MTADLWGAGQTTSLRTGRGFGDIASSSSTNKTNGLAVRMAVLYLCAGAQAGR
jgi:hypothetical protein